MTDKLKISPCKDVHICTHVCTGREGEAQRQKSLQKYSTCQRSGSNSQFWLFFWGGKGGKPKPGCLQRHLFSSACLVSGRRPPSQGGPEQSSGPAPRENHDPGNIFTRLGNAWPPTATSRSPPCPQTCWKPAQTLIFRARALVWESYS